MLESKTAALLIILIIMRSRSSFYPAGIVSMRTTVLLPGILVVLAIESSEEKTAIFISAHVGLTCR